MLNRTEYMITCRVLMAPHNIDSIDEKKILKKMFEVANPTSPDSMTALIASITPAIADDVCLGRLFSNSNVSSISISCSGRTYFSASKN